MSIWDAFLAKERRKRRSHKVKKTNDGKSPRWTDEEHQFLKEWYTKKPTAWISKKLRRSEQAVRNNARLLGLRFPRRKKWTKEDDDFIRKWYRKKPIGWIVEQLSSTTAAVHARAKELGVAKLSAHARSAKKDYSMLF
jgi:hypothetical protein